MNKGGGVEGGDGRLWTLFFVLQGHDIDKVAAEHPWGAVAGLGSNCKILETHALFLNSWLVWGVLCTPVRIVELESQTHTE